MKPRYLHTHEVHNLRSPSVLVPELIRLFDPTSVVDVGCGMGTFLAVFLQNGVQDGVGLDGDWVDKTKLYVDEKFFIEADLDAPVNLGRVFDLALCLEVVEHLAPESADTIVDSLCRLSETIVFSAALPGQGGDNHINEQPFDYWQEKFAARGYVYFDFFRERYWADERVDWWYRQNSFLVAKESLRFTDEVERTRVNGTVRTAIHPVLFAAAHRELTRLQRVHHELLTPAGAVRLAGRKLRRAVSGGKLKK